MTGPDRLAGISVVMPARNSGETIAATLDSLLAQTWQNWQAIIIDDGSTDATREIAERYAAKDARFRIIDGPVRGTAAAARNAGLAHADGEWLLFLDADDLLDPPMMERMMAGLAASPGSDAVHCGWRYVGWEGTAIGEDRCDDPGPDLFPIFARYCAFAIHTCIIRRGLVIDAGGFDESLRTSEDFDLWQRVARLGARFLAFDDCLATYRLRHDLSWFDGEPFLANVIEVVRRGHGPDPRLTGASVPLLHRNGMDAAGLPHAEINIVTYAAGIVIARGGDATGLLDQLHPRKYPLADSDTIANALVKSIPLALCKPQSAWENLWPSVEDGLAAYLKALETKSGAANLANRVLALLEQRTVRQCPLAFRDTPEVRIFGKTAAVGIEVTRPIQAIEAGNAERIVCFVFNYGHYFGSIVLPIFDGCVPVAVLKDAIAAQMAWPLLNSLFSLQIYPHLSVNRQEDGWSVYRGNVQLAAGLSADPTGPDGFHKAVGWPVFIQELTGCAGQSLDSLYDPSATLTDTPEQMVPNGKRPAVDLCLPIPALTGLTGDLADIEIRIGGSPAFLTRVAVKDGKVHPGELRAAALDRGGMELARIAVREAIVGHDEDAMLPLAERLRAAARDRENSRLPRDLPRNPLLLGSLRAGDLAEDLRRAALPSALAGPISAGIDPGQPLIAAGGKIDTCLYLPEIMARMPLAEVRPAPKPTRMERLLRRDFRNLPISIQAESNVVTDRLPILMYHAVANRGPAALARWRVTKKMFAAHMRHLKTAGYQPVTLDEWRTARAIGKSLPGRRVLITFDDGYADFAANVLPVLRQYGFPAMLFMPTGKVGMTADWDAWTGASLPLTDWDGLKRLRDAGIVFGSHSVSHRHLTGLSPREIAEELWNSRMRLSQELDVTIDAIAYPSGNHDEIVEHIAAACGYRHGLTTRDALSTMTDGNFTLARIEVYGQQTLQDFIARLPE